MSYRIGQAALNLQPTERVARSEFVYNWDVIRHYTGRDPRTDPGAEKAFNDLMGINFIWQTNDGPVHWRDRGRITDMGHAVWLADGSDFRPMLPCPFKTADEVLKFDAVEEYGLPDFDELVDYYENWYQTTRRYNNHQVIPGGYYNTLMSGAIQAFGWEMLLIAAGEEPERFGDKVLGSFCELSLYHCKAWAKTSIDFFECHDDMVWTAGPFMHPAFYYKYIFPRYEKIWQPLIDSGKKILFTSDGAYDMFFDPLIKAGAHGFSFEPSNNLELLAQRYGQDHVLIGGADCRTLTFGTTADIERELRWIFDVTRDCRGYIFCAGNQIPANVPLENAIFYFNLVEKLSKRP